MRLCFVVEKLRDSDSLGLSGPHRFSPVGRWGRLLGQTVGNRVSGGVRFGFSQIDYGSNRFCGQPIFAEAAALREEME